MTQAGLPRRIEANVSVQQVGQETLIYDEGSHKAFCLNRTGATVWRLCDGAHTEAQIATAATVGMAEPISEELVAFALDQLHRDGLLQALPSAPPPVLSRRQLVEKLGARALMLLPVVAAIVVPGPAHALSGVVDGAGGSQSRQSRARQRFAEDAASAPKPNHDSSDSTAP